MLRLALIVLAVALFAADASAGLIFHRNARSRVTVRTRTATPRAVAVPVAAPCATAGPAVAVPAPAPAAIPAPLPPKADPKPAPATPTASYRLVPATGHTHTCAAGHSWDHTMDGGTHRCPVCGLSQFVVGHAAYVYKPVGVVQTPAATVQVTQPAPSVASACASGACATGACQSAATTRGRFFLRSR